MTRNPPEHMRWQPGQSGNPAGRKKGGLTKDKVRAIMDRFAEMGKKELYDLSQKPDTPMIEAMIANIMLKASKMGDASRLEFLLQRAYGKVKEEVDVTTHNPQEDELRKLSLEQLIIFIQNNHTKAIE